MKGSTYISLLLILVVACFGLVACEKSVYQLEEEKSAGKSDKNDAGANLILRIVAAETRAGEDITNYWGTINFVAYQNNDKVKAITQQRGENGYGEAAMKLTPGTYQVLVLAHSSNGNPSLANPKKIDFTNTIGFTDTYYYYGDIVVEETAKEHTVDLKRASSLVHFIIKDELPATVNQFQFYYEGGSGALDATTGYGCEASRQSVYLDVDHEAGPPYTFDLYTMLRTDSATLKMQVKGFKSNNTIVKINGKDIRDFSIPVVRAGRVNFVGNFYAEDSDDTTSPDDEETDSNQNDPEVVDSTASTFYITADTTWHNTITITY